MDKEQMAVGIVWEVIRCRWKARRFLLGLGENHSKIRRMIRSGLPHS
jgi:hypothetical protein